MEPSQLAARDFQHYPELGRAFAEKNLRLLASLPLPLLASILREVIQYDWLFPAERDVLNSQCASLDAMTAQKRAAAVAEFGALSVPPELSGMDWVNKPARFIEDMTAYLWSSSQIDAFRTAAVHYAEAVKTSADDTPKVKRICAVVVPADLDKPGYPAFRKLRTHGVFFENVAPGWRNENLLEWMQAHAERASGALRHFYVDGGSAPPGASGALDQVTWSGAATVRQELLKRLERMTQTPGVGPEMARTQLASIGPEDLGLRRNGNDAVLDHFLVRVLTEGSGTQIFSTTFVQWAGRELLRRAEPFSLLMRYGARDEYHPMDIMLSTARHTAATDPAGSFVDADMGAYYTWLNLQRLSGAENARFLAFSEAKRQAVAIGPGLPRGTFAKEPMELGKILSLLA